MSSAAEDRDLVTTFAVTPSGTLSILGYREPKTRAEVYEAVSWRWSTSPESLRDAMADCQPLAWAVHRIYSAFRDELEAEFDAINPSPVTGSARLTTLRTALASMPEEPEDGVNTWLSGLAPEVFQTRVVTPIYAWFASAPDMTWESEYIPAGATAQGAALDFFEGLSREDLDTLGIELIYGEHPGSTYYAAELSLDVDKANRLAEAARIPVRFVREEP